MFEQRFLPKLSLEQKLHTLIIGRLMVVFLLLVSSWIWHSGNIKLSFENIPRGLFIVFVISVGLTVAYFFIMRLSTNYTWQIRIQFLLDALLTTWLVWRTGDVSSPYLTLYIVLISVASVFLSSRGTLVVSGVCVLLFTALALATSFSYIDTLAERPEVSRLVQVVGFHAVAFLIVGLLSARLAERYASNEKLKEATKTLANLRVLHERIIESIRSGLITVDTDGKIYTFNRMAEEITGAKADVMKGTSIYDFFGDIRVQIGEALKADEDQRLRYELAFEAPDGFVMQLGYRRIAFIYRGRRKNGAHYHISGSDRHSIDGRKR